MTSKLCMFNFLIWRSKFGMKMRQKGGNRSVGAYHRSSCTDTVSCRFDLVLLSNRSSNLFP